MPKSRIIYYSNSKSAIEWAILSENDAIEQVSKAQNVNEITSSNEKFDNIVLIASDNLTIHQTDIPSQSTRQLHQAIPYALEDELASDLNSCEFCLFHTDNGSQFTAVINQEYWNSLLKQFSSMRLTAIVPDIFALPYATNSWSILLIESRAIIRTGRYLGFTLDRDLLEYFLSESIKSIPDKPKYLNIYARENVKLTSDFIQVQQHKIENEFAFLLENLTTVTQYNCLSGKARQPSLALSPALPRISLGLLGVASACFLLGHFWQYKHLSSINDQYETEITHVYRQVFPNATQVIAPKVRFQRELNRLRENVSGGKVQRLLQAVAPAILNNKNVLVQEAHFANGQLRLKFSAQSIGDLEKVSKTLHSQQISAELSNATASDNRASADMIVKED